MTESMDTPDVKDGYLDNNLEDQKDEVLALRSIYDGEDMERVKIVSTPSDVNECLYTLHLIIPVKTDRQDIKVDILMSLTDESDSSEQITPPEVGKEINFMRSDSVLSSGDLKDPHNNTIDHVKPMFAECKIFGLVRYLGIEDRVMLMPVEQDEETDDPRAIPDAVCTDTGRAVSNMLQYNTFQFCRSNHECHVCFEEFPGSQFLRLSDCQHHFCGDCMTSYCKHHVSAGSVENLRCPDTGCDSIIPTDIIRRVLSAEEYNRWERLSLQKTLEFMKDVMWCPRCSSPVIREQEKDLHLAHCLTCFFSFCTLCRDPWHPGDYCESIEDQFHKSRPYLTERIRKRKLTEDLNSKALITKECKICPGCEAPVHRVSGCDFMTCRCGQIFCWRCGFERSFFAHQNCAAKDPIVEAVIKIKLATRDDPVTRSRQILTRCPTCGQRNLKEDRNNHIRCWACRSSFCFLCRKKIWGAIKSHFAKGLCLQHT